MDDKTALTTALTAVYFGVIATNGFSTNYDAMWKRAEMLAEFAVKKIDEERRRAEAKT